MRVVRLKTKGEIDAMAEAGKAVAAAVQAMKTAIEAGKTTTAELDQIAMEVLSAHGAKPSLLGYKPPFTSHTYQHASCISINEEVIHGVPSPSRVIKSGDVVGLDLVANIDGWHADHTITVLVGSGTKTAQRLISVTQESLKHGIQVVRPGATLGDVGFAVQRLVEKNGFRVLRDLAGHGIGRSVHEDGLETFNFGRPGRGVRLEPGMTFCIEPMTCLGAEHSKHRPGDPWTLYTGDNSIGCHFEHTVAVTQDGVRVLTGG